MIDALNAVPATPGADKVALAPAAADPGRGDGLTDAGRPSSPGQTNGVAQAAPGQPASDQTGARVQIDRNGAQGYVYRLIDTSSGRVIVEAPQEGLEQLTNHPAYAAGALVSTSA